VPSWAKDVKIGMRFINARAETALESGPFARAALARRCLVPADGWYEWQASPTVLDAKGKPLHPSGDAACFRRSLSSGATPSPTNARLATTFTIITTAVEPGLTDPRPPTAVLADNWPPGSTCP
jgi:putative SOS response-associated peptidase YedK